MLVALYDTETNGLLKEATTMHCVGAKFSDGRFLLGDPSGIDPYMDTITLPSGKVLQIHHTSVTTVLREIAEADIRVAHNGQDFDDRVTRKLFPWWNPRGRLIDTLLLSRLLYPVISREGPNSHKAPPKLRSRHSLEAWGYRLGEKKDKDFDPGDWQTWSPEMSRYMLQDIESLERLFKWLMFQKPAQESVEIEHGFAAIIRRQEAWGFTFDYAGALALQAKVLGTIGALESELIETYGEWWEPSNPVKIKTSRRVKLAGYPDVTQPRTGKNGKPLKPYVGPPMCYYEASAVYTPIERVEFNPGSREHVRKMLHQRHGWRPTKWTPKGTPQIDDEVLRALPYPEAPKLADYYAAKKISGYVAEGKKAWLSVAQEEGSEWRMHGRVDTIGTYTFRCSHYNPNMGQIPTRDPLYGHLCRRLFSARRGFRLVGFDGSGMQLRLLAHYLSYFGGKYHEVFERGEDPHAFLRDTIGVDLMGEGEDGRKKGKTGNYALCFGAGAPKLGSIVEPYADAARKAYLGDMIKERILPVFGAALDELKAYIKERVISDHELLGLDGRRARVGKPHVGLSTLLQMGEGVVMKKSLILLDGWLQDEGLHPGVDPTGCPMPDQADYEFCANVHDEAQADVREERVEIYRTQALRSVPEAGRLLGVRCPLKADVKVGDTWADTH